MEGPTGAKCRQSSEEVDIYRYGLKTDPGLQVCAGEGSSQHNMKNCPSASQLTTFPSISLLDWTQPTSYFSISLLFFLCPGPPSWVCPLVAVLAVITACQDYLHVNLNNTGEGRGGGRLCRRNLKSVYSGQCYQTPQLVVFPADS